MISNFEIWDGDGRGILFEIAEDDKIISIHLLALDIIEESDYPIDKFIIENGLKKSKADGTKDDCIYWFGNYKKEEFIKLCKQIVYLLEDKK